jgi:tetrahydromethanopterin S-methyltransferase subunit G
MEGQGGEEAQGVADKKKKRKKKVLSRGHFFWDHYFKKIAQKISRKVGIICSEYY